MDDLASVIFYNFGLRILFSFKVKDGKCYPSDEVVESSEKLHKKFLEDDSKLLKEDKSKFFSLIWF